MTSQAVVMRPTGNTTKDADGYNVPEWAQVYSGPCRIAGNRNAASSRRVTQGGVDVTLATREVHFPASAAVLRDGDLIEVVGGENAGAVLRILETVWQDQATARRVPVVEASRPKEWA